MKMNKSFVLISVATFFIISGIISALADENSIDLAKDSSGVRFDDLGFSKSLNKVVVPGGRTGKVFLIDPNTYQVSEISGLTVTKITEGKAPSGGSTSVDEGDGYFFVIDRSTRLVHIVDHTSLKILNSTQLSGPPDYVRFVSSTKEVWVTEPGEHKEAIEIFKLSMKPKPTLEHTGFISIPGGPESLVIDEENKRAYTNIEEGKTAVIVIDLKTREEVASWLNGYQGLRGLSLDKKRGLLFVSCNTGVIYALDIGEDGKVVGTATVPPGVDIISYNPVLSHLYVPSSKSGVLTVLNVSDTGVLSAQQQIELGYTGAHSVTNDGVQAWIPDPNNGRILYIKDEVKTPTDRKTTG